MPSNPVSYESNKTISCTSLDDLGTDPIWQLKKLNGIFNITNGTEANVASRSMQTSVTLFKTTELWAGMFVFICDVKQLNILSSH